MTANWAGRQLWRWPPRRYNLHFHHICYTCGVPVNRSYISSDAYHPPSSPTPCGRHFRCHHCRHRWSRYHQSIPLPASRRQWQWLCLFYFNFIFISILSFSSPVQLLAPGRFRVSEKDALFFILNSTLLPATKGLTLFTSIFLHSEFFLLFEFVLNHFFCVFPSCKTTIFLPCRSASSNSLRS